MLFILLEEELEMYSYLYVRLLYLMMNVVGTACAGSPQHLESTARFLPNQPMLSTEDLPWLIGTPAARKSRFKFWSRTLERSRNLKWLLVNSFPEEYMDDIKQQYHHSKGATLCRPKVLLVGPLSKHATIAKNPSLWEEDKSCIDWLDNQKPNSVIYISFGSWVSPIGEEKVKTLALTLEALGLPFIWVLGFAWREGLPDGYLDRVSNSRQGKVVPWAPQLKVLQHNAVGFYLTHCGWNSTMEAIQSGKRLLCYPVAGDQFINCAYIVKMWKIGIRVNGFGKRDIEDGLKKLKEDSEMKHRLMNLYMRTMGDDGARARVMNNLTGFVDDLSKLTRNDHQFHLKDVDHDHLFNL